LPALTAVRVPEDIGFLAEADGLDHFIGMLERVRNAWAAR